MAFVNYVENNPLDIIGKKNITVEDLIVNAYSKNAGPLLKYITKRKVKFAKGTSDSLELSDIQENMEYDQQIKMKDFLCV